jgi:hypothetical protein
MNALWDCYTNQHGKIDEEAYLNLVSKTQYNRFIKPLEGIEGVTIPPLWTPKLIAEHRKIAIDPEMELRTDFRTLKHLCLFLEDHIGTQIEGGKNGVKPNLEVIKTYQSLRRDKEALGIKLVLGLRK